MRYELFRLKNSDMSSGPLPPCKDALQLHIKRVNYQVAIWRRSLKKSPTIPDATDGHGWKVDGDEQICSEWIAGAPELGIALSLMSCKCEIMQSWQLPMERQLITLDTNL